MEVGDDVLIPFDVQNAFMAVVRKGGPHGLGSSCKAGSRQVLQ